MKKLWLVGQTQDYPLFFPTSVRNPDRGAKVHPVGRATRIPPGFPYQVVLHPSRHSRCQSDKIVHLAH